MQQYNKTENPNDKKKVFKNERFCSELEDKIWDYQLDTLTLHPYKGWGWGAWMVFLIPKGSFL